MTQKCWQVATPLAVPASPQHPQGKITSYASDVVIQWSHIQSNAIWNRETIYGSGGDLRERRGTWRKEEGWNGQLQSETNTLFQSQELSHGRYNAVPDRVKRAGSRPARHQLIILRYQHSYDSLRQLEHRGWVLFESTEMNPAFPK